MRPDASVPKRMRVGVEVPSRGLVSDGKAKGGGSMGVEAGEVVCDDDDNDDDDDDDVS
jgi:hypothetical protein